jgi:hypothetical protein
MDKHKNNKEHPELYWRVSALRGPQSNGGIERRNSVSEYIDREISRTTTIQVEGIVNLKTLNNLAGNLKDLTPQSPKKLPITSGGLWDILGGEDALKYNLEIVRDDHWDLGLFPPRMSTGRWTGK